MLFPEEDGPLLKTWIVKRIENTSDADADVLADYVIALLKHDGDRDAVRKLCEEEIPDFLTEDPKAFLDDVFQTIAYKSYVPGAPPAPKLGAATPSSTQPLTQPPTQPQPPTGPVPNGSRKRGFHDRGEVETRDGPSNEGRAMKQARRRGRGERDDGRGGRSQQAHGLPPRPDLSSFDPGNPLEAFMQLQAMGMPYPGMQNFPTTLGARNQPRKRGRCRDFDTKGYCSRGSTCLFDHGNESIFMPTMGPQDGEYNPPDPHMFSMPNPPNMFSFNQERGRGRGPRKGRNSKKGGSRASFSADGPVHDRSKSTIVVENIPEESFSEDAVRTFFSQFGTILEISMQPYKHLAVVKYDKWNAANAAYRSPKVIFDNRFVKVFWFKDETDVLPPSMPLNGISQFDGQDQPPGEDAEPEIDMEEFQRKQEEAQKQHQEREDKREEIEQKRLELEKQQQELFAKHREENEKLQAKLSDQASRNGTPSTGADMLRAKLAALEQEAKMLGIDPDAEDDYAAYPPARGGYRGRGGPRGRGHTPRGRGSFRGGRGGMHAAYAQYSIDNRPKKIAVKGVDFTSSEKDEALRHFLLNLGEFESVDTSSTITHVSFQDRKTAEKFYYSLHNKELPGVDGKLDLAWVSSPLPPVETKPAAPQGTTDPDRDETMVAVDEAPPARAQSPDPVQHEQRVVNMDYEVADDDAWGD